MTDFLDEALLGLSRTAPELRNGNTNHGPMVAETLTVIGRGEVVPSWMDAYLKDADERPADHPAFDPADWREFLGRPGCWAEWVSFFRRDLSERAWRDTLDSWASRLAPGLSGAATHGLIRTAHAARALGGAATEPRLHELADALAYWAATYREFPAPPPSKPDHMDLESALARVPEVEVPAAGNIDQTLRGLDDVASFAPVINLLQTGEDPLVDLSALTARFATVYLNNAHDPARTFAVVHAVTGPAALRLLAPYLTRSARELLLLYAWQAAAAIYAVWDRERTVREQSPAALSCEELTQAAVTNGSAHAIKFVEACLREHEHNPQPVYLAAAADAAERLTG